MGIFRKGKDKHKKLSLSPEEVSFNRVKAADNNVGIEVLVNQQCVWVPNIQTVYGSALL